MAKTMTRSKTTKAKKPKKNAESRTNARPRDVVIREANRRLDAIERQRESLRDQEKMIKNSLIKGELGESPVNFMAARRLAKMDPAKRAGLFGAIREQFQVAKDGGTVDFLKVMEEEDRKVVADLTAKLDQTEEAAEAQGREAGAQMVSMAENPYPPKSKHSAAWDRGHRAGLMDRLTGPTAAAE